jgi:hypothetical protein
VPSFLDGAAQLDSGAVAGAAGRRHGEDGGMFVFEQLAGEVFAVHGQHDFAGGALGQGVEAAEKHQPLINDDDLLVHVVYLDDRGEDRSELSKVCLAGGSALQIIAGVTHEQPNREPAGDPFGQNR